LARSSWAPADTIGARFDHPDSPCALLHRAFAAAHEFGDVLDVVDDEGDRSVGAQHRGVDRTPVVNLESAVSVGNVIFLHAHQIGGALLYRPFKRKAQIAFAGRRRMVGIVRKDRKQALADDLVAVGSRRLQIAILDVEDLELGSRAQHQIRMRRRLEQKLIVRKHTT
jgi:hypothetical protein